MVQRDGGKLMELRVKRQGEAWSFQRGCGGGCREMDGFFDSSKERADNSKSQKRLNKNYISSVMNSTEICSY